MDKIRGLGTVWEAVKTPRHPPLPYTVKPLTSPNLSEEHKQMVSGLWVWYVSLSLGHWQPDLEPQVGSFKTHHGKSAKEGKPPYKEVALQGDIH